MQFQPLQLLLMVCHLHSPHTKISTDNCYKFEHQNLIKSTGPNYRKTFSLTISYNLSFLSTQRLGKLEYKFASFFCCHEKLIFITLSLLDLRLFGKYVKSYVIERTLRVVNRSPFMIIYNSLTSVSTIKIKKIKKRRKKLNCIIKSSI